MKKYLNKKNIIIALLGLLFVVMPAFVLATINTWDGGYQLPASGQLAPVLYGNTPNYCAAINNTSGNTYFVPSRTVAEFNSMVAHPPTGVSFSCAFSGCVNPNANWQLWSYNCKGRTNCGYSTTYADWYGVRYGGGSWYAGCQWVDNTGACECRYKTVQGHAYLYCTDFDNGWYATCRVP